MYHAQYDRSISNGQKWIFYYLIIALKNPTFGSFLTFYYVLHRIFHANFRISENRQFFEVLTFSLFLRIELSNQEKILNFQVLKKVFGTMLEYINMDTKNAEYGCFAFENQRTWFFAPFETFWSFCVMYI